MEKEIAKDFFKAGISQGLLYAEEERRNEENFDAAIANAYDKKHSMPYNLSERRRLHSKEWFDAHTKAVVDFMRKIENLGREFTENEIIK